MKNNKASNHIVLEDNKTKQGWVLTHSKNSVSDQEQDNQILCSGDVFGRLADENKSHIKEGKFTKALKRV